MQTALPLPAGSGGPTAAQPSFDALGRSLYDTTFVVLDLETTGLRAGEDRITEVGAVKVRRGEVLGELHTLVHPGRGIPPAITAVTGITDAMVAGAPPIEAVLPTLLEFLRDTALVAHNARFDVGFLDAELTRRGYGRLTNPVVDTARLARRVLRDEVRDCRLSTLARHLRARTSPEHRALLDARATVDVLHGLLERAGSLGAVTLEDVRDLCTSRSDAAFRKVSLVDGAPRAPGVYRFLDDRGEVLYVGKATDLRGRLRTYFGQDPRRRIADMVRETAKVTWELTPTELEANVREVRAIVAHQPRYNRRSKHPSRAVWLALTDEAFPRLSIVRTPREGPMLGPFTSRRRAESLVDAVHEVVPVRRCTFRIRRAQDHPTCALKDLGRCGAPCDGTQDAAAYTAAIAPLVALLDGDARDVLEALRARMGELAGAQRYEEAARVRRRLHALADVVASARTVAPLERTADLVVRRPGPGDVHEVVRLRDGRLWATAVVPGVADDRDAAVAVGVGGLLDPVAPPAEEVPPAARAEEQRLVARWLAGRGCRVVHVDGELAEPVRGGAAVHAAAAEARRLSRQVGRDRQVLAGDKVARRG
ncbi:MAG: DEDD exonuclease domain-containing protein [Actinomycetes bacterium]